MSDPSIASIVGWTIGPPLVAVAIAAVVLRWVVRRVSSEEQSDSCPSPPPYGTIRAAGSTGTHQDLDRNQDERSTGNV